MGAAFVVVGCVGGAYPECRDGDLIMRCELSSEGSCLCTFTRRISCAPRMQLDARGQGLEKGGLNYLRRSETDLRLLLP